MRVCNSKKNLNNLLSSQIQNEFSIKTGYIVAQRIQTSMSFDVLFIKSIFIQYFLMCLASDWQRNWIKRTKGLLLNLFACYIFFSLIQPSRAGSVGTLLWYMIISLCLFTDIYRWRHSCLSSVPTIVRLLWKISIFATLCIYK